MLQKRDHIHYFDYLRIIAAISVIYMHVAAIPLRGAVNMQWQMLNVCTSFAFTAVPLFFMISGYLLLSDPKTKDISVLLRRRIPRLISSHWMDCCCTAVADIFRRDFVCIFYSKWTNFCPEYSRNDPLLVYVYNHCHVPDFSISVWSHPLAGEKRAYIHTCIDRSGFR